MRLSYRQYSKFFVCKHVISDCYPLFFGRCQCLMPLSLNSSEFAKWQQFFILYSLISCCTSLKRNFHLLYQFPGAVVINNHKLQELKTIEFYSHGLEATSPKYRCWQGHTPSRGSRGEFAYCLFQPLVAADIPCGCITLIVTTVDTFPLLFIHL